MVQKIYSKMHPASSTNTHHDVTDLVKHGMVKNTKTWISWERNIAFLQKKILNLPLRWHIWRSYCFVAEKTPLNARKDPCIQPLFNDSKFITDFKEKSQIFSFFFAKQCLWIDNGSTLPSLFPLITDKSLSDGRLLDRGY